MKLIQLLSIAICLGVMGCSPSFSPYTQDLHQTHRWEEADLKKVQFYLSEDVVLRRELSTGESAIEEGKIIMEKGRRVEEVVFPEGTPGILAFMPKENRMAVSFESGKDKFLMFGPNPKANNRYVLLASDWNRRVGYVNYNGKRYRTSADNAFAGLLVDLDHINKTTVQRRRAKGRTVRG